MGFVTLAKGLRFRIGEDGKIYAAVSSSSGEFYVAPEVFSLLRSIGNKSTLFHISKAPKSKELIADLLAAGLLLASEEQPDRALLTDGFGDPWIQWAMLADHSRCQTYAEALKKNITHSSVVLDVGAGTGFLSAAALAFGAQKVIAIEETASANVIKPILTQLKQRADTKNFILQKTNSFDAKIPSDINLVVSELFGNDPFSEGIIATLRDINARFSGKNVKFIPEKLELYFEVIHIFSHPALERIEAFALDPVVKPRDDNAMPRDDRDVTNITKKFLHAAGNILDLDNISFPLAINKQDFERISQSIKIGECELNPPPHFSKDKKKHSLKGMKILQINKEVENTVAIFWFRVQLVPGITLSSHPMEKDCALHWSPIAIPLKKSLQKGNILKVNYALNEEETMMQFDILYENKKIGTRK